MMWLMLQQPKPEDFVIATGQQLSVREFVQRAAREVGLEIVFEGNGATEVGIETVSGREVVKVDPRYYRPAEVETLLGDPSKAHRKLAWQPRISFPELVSEMATADLQLAKRDLLMRQNGYNAGERIE